MEKKIKVAHVIRVFSYGGAEVLLRECFAHPYFKEHVFKEDLIFREFMVNIYFDIKGRIFDDFSENAIKYIKTLPLMIEGRILLKEIESFINDNMSEVGRCTAETSNTLMDTVKDLFTNIIGKDYNVLLKENFWYFNYYEKQVIDLYLKCKCSPIIWFKS